MRREKHANGDNLPSKRENEQEQGARIAVGSALQEAFLEAEVACESLSKREVGKLHI